MPYSNPIAMYDRHRPTRILHVVAAMARGGTEAWLMNILRRIDRDRFQMDFMVHTTEPCPYADEIRNLGSQVIHCPYVSKPWRYASRFKRILREYGPYDIVHSHVHHFSGYILRLSKQARIPIRIAHSHVNLASVEAKATLQWDLYFALTKQWINQYATHGLGCSRDASANLFGANWNADSRWKILYCGIDLEPIRQPVNRITVRAELSIPQDAFVVGHVGRFVEQKNHTFLLEIAAHVVQQEPKMHLLLVGGGPLQSTIQQRSEQLGLDNHITFAGSQSNVPRLMRAMDIFLFPSLYEGLGLVLIEAQAVGLRCILADGIPVEADVVHSLMHRLSLLQPPQQWAEMILAQRFIPPPIAPAVALALVEESPFNIERSLESLQSFYEGQCLHQQPGSPVPNTVKWPFCEVEDCNERI